MRFISTYSAVVPGGWLLFQAVLGPMLSLPPHVCIVLFAHSQRLLCTQASLAADPPLQGLYSIILGPSKPAILQIENWTVLSWTGAFSTPLGLPSWSQQSRLLILRLALCLQITSPAASMFLFGVFLHLVSASASVFLWVFIMDTLLIYKFSCSLSLATHITHRSKFRLVCPYTLCLLLSSQCHHALIPSPTERLHLSVFTLTCPDLVFHALLH